MKTRVLAAAIVLTVVLVSAGSVWAAGEREAAAYPTKAVSVVVPWAAGGGTDRVARFWADEFQKELGRPFVVVNRTGGGGAVGHSAGAQAAPDGYTITMVTFELGTMHHMGLTDVSYADYDYIVQMNEDPAGVIVRRDAPWQTLDDLLDDIRSNPGQRTFSGTAVGGVWDLARIGMLLEAGIDPATTTWAPSQGAAPAIVELLGGHVDVITCSLPEAQSQLESGDLRALAIMADQRHATFTDVPTLKEQGIDWSVGAWRAFALPKGTPPDVRRVLMDAGMRIADSTGFRDFMQRNGFGIQIRSGDDFATYIAEQDATWGVIIKEVGY